MTDLLERFVEKTDRQAPPHFVGRTEIMEKIKRDLHNRLRDWNEQAPDAWESPTWLIQGAPGAGKTALLRELENRLPKQIQSDKPLRICRLDHEELEDKTLWQKKLAEALSPGAAKAMETTEMIQLQVKLGLPILQTGTDVREQAPTLTWSKLLIQYRENPQNFHPVVLCIDEIQNTTGDKDSPAAKTLQWLHKGTDQLPLLPIYGGLAWSEQRLDELGISRLSIGRVHTLDLLSEAERSEAVYAFLEKPAYRIQAKAEDKDWWAQQITNECHGWPQHLHGSLHALAKGLLEENVNRHLDKVDAALAAQTAQAIRHEYYEKRLSNSRLQNRSALAAIGMLLVQAGQQLGAPLSIAGLGDALEGFAGRQGTEKRSPDYYLPEHTSGTDFVAKGMIGAGLLHQGKKGENLSVPIPSFITYLQQQYPATLAITGVYQNTITGPEPIQSLWQALGQLNRSSNINNQ